MSHEQAMVGAVERRFALIGGVYGLLAVALGAFGAHGLAGHLGEVDDGALRQGWWETAAHYHLVHAMVLVGCAWLVGRAPSRAARVAGACTALGVAVFSGSLYVMALTGARWLGAVTPVGGLLLMVGWGAFAVGACRVPGAGLRPPSKGSEA